MIVSTLSPDYGKIDFVIKGAKRISKRAFPVVDIFREFNVEFREKENTKLNVPMSLDLLAEYDDLALFPEKLRECAETTRFLLRNVYPHVACYLVYSAFINMLKMYSKGADFPSFFVRLVYLYENGLLPQQVEGTDTYSAQKILKILINGSVGKLTLPVIGEEYMIKLKRWIEYLCEFNDLGPD